MNKQTLLLVIAITTISLFNFSSVAFSAECQFNDPATLAATYRIEKNLINGQHNHKELTIWRKDHSVAHQDSNRAVTEIWSKIHDNRIKLYRQFDAHQRGIEYTTEEIQSQHLDWSSKYQLIPSQLKQQLVKTKTEQQACWTEEHYSSAFPSQTNKNQTKLVWIPELQIIQSLELSGDLGTKIWTLEALNQDPKTIQQAFAQWNDYHLTDYADIGDNESDPFLMKMINLGFIEHGASGFYNDKGEQLKAEHGHNH